MCQEQQNSIHFVRHEQKDGRQEPMNRTAFYWDVYENLM